MGSQANGPRQSRKTVEQVLKEYNSFEGELGTVDLTLDSATGFATLCLNNPRRRNGFSGRMMVQLHQHLNYLKEWKQGKALFIYGADGFFCSGPDLNLMRRAMDTQGGCHICLIMHRNLEILESLPLLTVAVIRGMAIGGGCEITTACDFRLAAPNAKLGFVHVRLGLTAGWGGATRLVNLIGKSKALRMMTAGNRLSAQEALEWGLVDHILSEAAGKSETPDEVVLEESRQWIAPHVFQDSSVVQAIKRITIGATQSPAPESLRREAELFTGVFGAAPHRRCLAQNIKHKD